MQTTIIALDAISLTIMFIILYGYFRNNVVKDYKSHAFLFLAVVGTIGTFCDMLSFIYAGNPSASGAVWFFNLMTLICAIWFGVSYCGYIAAIVAERRSVPLFIYGIGAIGGVAATIFTIIMCATGKAFSIVEGSYISGDSYYMIIICIMFFALYSIVLVCAYFNTIGRSYAISLLAYVLAPVITTALEIIFPGLAINYVGLSIATLILYIFVQGEEVKTFKLNEEAAKRVVKAKSDFFARFSHELRAPINAVIGLDELILRSSKEDVTLGYAQDIQSAGNTLLGIINDILDSSRIESCKVEIIEVSYEPIRIINDLFNMINTRAASKGLKFNINLDSNLPSKLYGDEIKIKQIITNLLTNAVKYTEKGQVDLNIGFEKISDEYIELKVSVTDTGMGIKKEDIDKLFSPFSRIDELRNRYVEGTGLGMFITQSYLGMMNSGLNVSSDYGNGSTFKFNICQKVESWEPVGDFKEAFNKLHTKKHEYKVLFTAPEANVLIVDDTPVNLLVCKKILEPTKMNCDVAHSGEEAISMCSKKRYNVILMDHMMPGMDGIEAKNHIKEDADSVNKETPIIVVTANASSGAREMLIPLGFDDYLSKPIEYKKMEQMIMSYLPKDMVSSQ